MRAHGDPSPIFLFATFVVFFLGTLFIEKIRNKSYKNTSLVGKPYLILHVGPSKTATTSIQHFLEQQMNNSVLVEDSYRYIGRRDNHAMEKLLDCMLEAENLFHKGKKKDCRGGERWNDFLETMKAYSENGTNLVISNEAYELIDYTRNDWSEVEDTLKKYFDVRVVIAYRRFYDWLASWYVQYFIAGGPLLTRVKRWPDDPKNPGIVVPPFNEYAMSIYKRRTHRNLQSNQDEITHPTLQMKKHFETKFPVNILNFHGSNIITQFVSFLPGATHTRNAALTWTEPPMNGNKSLHYDMIATAAYKKKLLKPQVKRLQAVLYLTREHTHRRPEPLADPPLICPSPDEEMTLKYLSWAFEKEMYPDIITDSMERHHHKGFEKVKKKNKFCSINADKIIKRQRLRQMLMNFTPHTHFVRGKKKEKGNAEVK